MTPSNSTLPTNNHHLSTINYHLSIILLLLLTLSSCIREEQFDNTPRGNFEALWKTIDERYCYLDYKQVDWDDVHDRYAPLITDDMSSSGLFEVLGNMLAELKDGHVNLYSTSNMARYWNWYLDYPRNFNESIIEQYLGRDYRIAGGIKYTILEDNIGYAQYEDFSSGVGEGNLDEVLSYFAICDGLIIDVRNNGGGVLTYAERFASRFTNEKVLTGYIMHKTGKGHSDFSEPEPVYVTPSNSIRWQKPVIVLTNRHAYSATNDFVNAMRYFPNVTLVGDKTGGGAGLPFSSELPNGWGVRFSASPHLDADRRHIEFGIDPDIKVDMTSEDEARGVDTIIETARQLIGQQR
ncbi:MAG: S41 family peptidase [Bacteroides sp.]|nr:S41 family peptidase [Bacteroides sp.]